ncbi:saccharopine dehydrogenase family protein [Saliphagus infecundisoli]|uniref:Saccharopine dehydrogenase family protein n=1 Tax=Saliphagus infecundisoli TaxID=1849069 RepID=A0ABD5QGQ7_9EURY|nr:saccharopine dehydrogenase NADP-binding domain-containing protein [Saliphagus infecundisoli]
MDLLVYGSYGYTGRLIAHRLVRRGREPTLAGRNRDRLEDQADALGLESRAFSLDGPTEGIVEYLEGFDAVLNCAGPFVDTCGPLVEACLEAGTDYLDITGEFRVFEDLIENDDRAREAGIALLPGAGFDIVPSDCLAAFLADQLGSVEELTIGIAGGASISAGTARTILRMAGEGAVVRREGRLRRVPAADDVREIEFGRGYGTRSAVTVPWADVVSAPRSTGAEDVTAYAAVPSPAIGLMRRMERLAPLVGSRPARWLGDRLIDAAISGPSARERATGSAVVWAEATDGDDVARGRVETSEPYGFTAQAATAIAERVVAGEVDPGYQTPATALGPDLVLEFPGVDRELLVAPGEVP